MTAGVGPRDVLVPVPAQALPLPLVLEQPEQRGSEGRGVSGGHDDAAVGLGHYGSRVTRDGRYYRLPAGHVVEHLDRYGPLAEAPRHRCGHAHVGTANRLGQPLGLLTGQELDVSQVTSLGIGDERVLRNAVAHHHEAYPLVV